MNKVVDIFAGGWELSGTSRMQIQNLRADGIRLVGMSKDELQKEFKIRITSNPTTGATIVLMMRGRHHPEHAPGVQHRSDVGHRLQRARRARRPLHRAAPAAKAASRSIRATATRRDQIVINGPWFVRFDIRAHEARADQGTVDGGVQLRVDEPVRQHQLQPGASTRAAAPGSSR